MPLVQTRGAASAQGFGEFAQAATAITYIEDVFSCFLYTGTGSSQTITNNIDLSTKGGLTWIKGRSGTTGHRLTDTARGATKSLASETTDAEATETTGLTAFGTTGFTIGADADYNTSAATYCSWTFRKQPKFFDIVTFTGNSTNRAIAHNLGSVPACIIVKGIDDFGGQNWNVYHKDIGNGNRLLLNTTNGTLSAATTWNNTSPTSTEFTVGTSSQINFSGANYVAYLFAHDAGGFGLTGTDNVISCGLFTASGVDGNADVTLGYEPQWILVKRSDSTGNWFLFDTMRGITQTSAAWVYANLSNAEDTSGSGASFFPTATGFYTNNFISSGNYIYIAIRRGPMKVPTVGTSVFGPVARTGTGVQTNVGGLSFSPDLLLVKNRGNTQLNWAFDRLRGGNEPLSSNSSDDEATNTATYFGGSTVFKPNNTGFGISSAAQVNTTSGSYANWLFGRAPSFFDEVCYTGNNTNGRNITHNLGVVPELIIVKNRVSTYDWTVYNAVDGYTYNLYLNTTAAKTTANQAWYAAPTTTTFSVTNGTDVNSSSSNTYVAYLFATCAGVSKVGSYTGTGTTLQIDCGFTGGARFVLIKRTDSTGDWYVWDTARGIVSGSDPYLRLNSTAAEVTSTDYIDTYSAGFEISSTAPAAINSNGGSYIFLAIA